VEPLATRCLDEAFQAASLKSVTQLSRRLNDRLPGRVLARIEIEYQPVGLLQVAGPAAPGVKFGHARLHEAHEPRETIDRQHRLLLAGPDALHDITQARPGMHGEKALGAGAGGASQQTQDPSSDMWKNPGGNSGVKIRQSLFGDARLRPKNPFGMCEPDTGYAGVGPRF
jgi:hypothetical protein